MNKEIVKGEHLESAEHVLPGHPDKLCDAIVDSIVDEVTRGDEGAQCGLEAAVIFNNVYLTGRIAAAQEVLDQLDIDEIVRRAWKEAGYGKDKAGYVWGPTAQALRIRKDLCLGPFEEGERELRHLSDDQAICVGYACDCPGEGYMPPAQFLARRIAHRLYELRGERGAGEMGPDGKVLVQVRRRRDKWVATRVSLSINHHEGSDWVLLRRIAQQAVEDSTVGQATPDIVINGAGTFISGGPNGDNGLSGKKLVVDAYGPTVPIGGGAWSGKDFRKVDRLGGMLARELALRVILKKAAFEAIVRLSYFPGSAGPATIEAVLDGRAISPRELFDIIGPVAVDNLSVWKRYKDPHLPLSLLARWGHQQPGTPWEVRA